MDTLTSRFLPRDTVESVIAAGESRHSNMRADNARIRDLVANGKAPAGIDVDAALMSDCRTDSLTCGRCAFWGAVRRSAKV